MHDGCRIVAQRFSSRSCRDTNASPCYKNFARYSRHPHRATRARAVFSTRLLTASNLKLRSSSDDARSVSESRNNVSCVCRPSTELYLPNITLAIRRRARHGRRSNWFRLTWRARCTPDDASQCDVTRSLDSERVYPAPMTGGSFRSAESRTLDRFARSRHRDEIDSYDPRRPPAASRPRRNAAQKLLVQ